MKSTGKAVGRWWRRIWPSRAVFISLLLLWMAALIADDSLHGFAHLLLALAMVQLIVRIAKAERLKV